MNVNGDDEMFRVYAFNVSTVYSHTNNILPLIPNSNSSKNLPI